MRRREFITLLTGAAMAGPRLAQAQPSKVYRLATLNSGAPFADKSPFGAILVRVLGERGYTLGQNLTFEPHGAMGQLSKLPGLLQEIKANKADAIVESAVDDVVASDIKAAAKEAESTDS